MCEAHLAGSRFALLPFHFKTLLFAMLVRDIFNMISTLTGALQAAEVTARAELCWRLLQSKRNSTVFLLVGLQLKKKIVYFSCNFFLLKKKYQSICFLLSLVDLFWGFFLTLQLYFVKLWVRPYNCFCTNYWHCCECQINDEAENKNKTMERKVDNKYSVSCVPTNTLLQLSFYQ